jgi:D-alanyl-D-alanine carboxypeptidase
MTMEPNLNSQHDQHNKDKVIVASTVIGLVLIILLFVFTFSKNQYIRIDEIRSPLGIGFSSSKSSKKSIDPFKNMEVTARAAVVWDVRNQKFLYKKNEEHVLPLASLTKLMTALAATEILPKGSTIKINPAYLVGEDADKGLFANENWNADDLISLTLLSSSNSGAKAIASVSGAFLSNITARNPISSFIDYMNDRAQRINLASLKFYNDSGLDVSENQSGGYGNASDIALLTDYITQNHPDILEQTKHSRRFIVSQDNFVHDIRNTNTIIEQIPGIAGSKTGYTDLAQGNLVVSFAPGLQGPYIAVVLGSTYDGRFADITKLVEATMQSINP